ncbi:hypothetical protein HMPREF3036_01872 [Sutterella sp. KLE1602]|nr:hypothetical protein HMPREF3036_01872 [Sutterella sp. KLE1602]
MRFWSRGKQFLLLQECADLTAHSLFLPESKIGFQACQGALDT